MKKEVTVTMLKGGDMEWDCGICSRRVRAGKHGLTKDCEHTPVVRAKAFDCVVAIYDVPEKP